MTVLLMLERVHKMSQIIVITIATKMLNDAFLTLISDECDT